MLYFQFMFMLVFVTESIDCRVTKIFSLELSNDLIIMALGIFERNMADNNKCLYDKRRFTLDLSNPHSSRLRHWGSTPTTPEEVVNY